MSASDIFMAIKLERNYRLLYGNTIKNIPTWLLKGMLYNCEKMVYDYKFTSLQMTYFTAENYVKLIKKELDRRRNNEEVSQNELLHNYVIRNIEDVRRGITTDKDRSNELN